MFLWDCSTCGAVSGVVWPARSTVAACRALGRALAVMREQEDGEDAEETALRVAQVALSLALAGKTGEGSGERGAEEADGALGLPWTTGTGKRGAGSAAAVAPLGLLALCGAMDGAAAVARTSLQEAALAAIGDEGGSLAILADLCAACGGVAPSWLGPDVEAQPLAPGDALELVTRALRQERERWSGAVRPLS